MENKQFGIHFGFMSDSLRVQLHKQGFKSDPIEVKAFQQDLDSVLSLHLRGILVDSQRSKCLDRLYKKVRSHVEKKNKMKAATKVVRH